MKTFWRRRAHSDTWHFCSNCSNWPQLNQKYGVIEVFEKPTSGELCNQCQLKVKRGLCQSAEIGG